MADFPLPSIAHLTLVQLNVLSGSITVVTQVARWIFLLSAFFGVQAKIRGDAPFGTLEH